MALGLAAALGMGAIGCEDEAETEIAEDQAQMAEQVAEEGTPTGDTELVTFTATEWEIDRDLNYVPDVLDAELRRAALPEADALPARGEAAGVASAGKDCFLAQCAEPAQQSGLRQWPRQVNTMILLDASGSMADEVDGKTKIDVARDAVRDYLEAMPDEEVFRTGLIVFGHKGDNTLEAKPESCDAVETIVPLGKSRDATSVEQALGRFEPSGWTPIDQALRQAAERLPREPYVANRIVLISDGVERCGGDPLATVREFVDQGVFGRVDVIGFEAGTDVDLSGLKALAGIAGEGEYYKASNVEDFSGAFEELRGQTEQAEAAWRCGIEKQEALSACYTAYGERVTAMVEGPERTVKVVGEEGAALTKQTAQRIAQAVDKVVAELQTQARRYGAGADAPGAAP